MAMALISAGLAGLSAAPSLLLRVVLLGIFLGLGQAACDPGGQGVARRRFGDVSAVRVDAPRPHEALLNRVAPGHGAAGAVGPQQRDELEARAPSAPGASRGRS